MTKKTRRPPKRSTKRRSSAPKHVPTRGLYGWITHTELVSADPAATKQALKFFQWAYQNGDPMAAGLDYVSFPNDVKQKIMASWNQVQGWNGGR